MKTSTRRNRTAIALGAGAMITITSASLAYASLVDSSGAIHGCVNTASGLLRVVPATTGKTAPCRADETPLAWNQTGPTGPPGPAASTDLGATRFEVHSFTAPAGADVTVGDVYCLAPNLIATGGGYFISPDDGADLTVIASLPQSNLGSDSKPNRWNVYVRNNTGRPFFGRPISFVVYVVCAPSLRGGY